MIQLNIFDELKKNNITTQKICEIGVYQAKTCSSIDFINDGQEVTLIEADPTCVENIVSHYGKRNNVKILSKAIWHKRKTLTFYRVGASTFASDIEKSPAIVNDKYHPSEKDTFKVDAVPFGDIDPGDFDVILIDVEGAEWNVVSRMKSLPKIISIEMRANLYINPKKKEINEWLRKNNYELLFHNDTDSVFIQKGIKIYLLRKILYSLHNIHVDLDQWWKYFRKTLKKRLQSFTQKHKGLWL